MNTILKYFPKLTEEQRWQFEQLLPLYQEWNSKINVVSRKDIDNIYLHHVLHSLAIAKMVRFRAGTNVLDIGTGGGFPGIPLAIMFPESRFTLIDRTGKKIAVVREITKEIRLANVEAYQRAGEEERGYYDFVVSRAVMPLPDLVKIVRKNIKKSQQNALPNGVICLKGGDISAEIAPFRRIVDVTDIHTIFTEDWFEQKYIIYVPL